MTPEMHHQSFDAHWSPTGDHLEWVIVQCAPHVVVYIKESLLDEGLSPYVPVLVQWKRPHRARRPRRVETPAYPGYLFLPDHEVEFIPRGLPRHTFLQNHGHHMSINNREIVRIMDEETTWEKTLARSKPAQLNVGDMAYINAGVLKGCAAEVVWLGNGNSVKVMVAGWAEAFNINACLLGREPIYR